MAPNSSFFNVVLSGLVVLGTGAIILNVLSVASHTGTAHYSVTGGEIGDHFDLSVSGTDEKRRSGVDGNNGDDDNELNAVEDDFAEEGQDEGDEGDEYYIHNDILELAHGKCTEFGGVQDDVGGRFCCPTACRCVGSVCPLALGPDADVLRSRPCGICGPDMSVDASMCCIDRREPWGSTKPRICTMKSGQIVGAPCILTKSSAVNVSLLSSLKSNNKFGNDITSTLRVSTSKPRQSHVTQSTTTLSQKQNTGRGMNKGMGKDARPAGSPWRRAKAEADQKIADAEGVHGDSMRSRPQNDIKRLTAWLEKEASKPEAAQNSEKIEKTKAELEVAKIKLVATEAQERAVAADVARRERIKAAFKGPEVVWGGMFEPLPELHVTYESCAASLAGRAKAKSLQRPLWIHFPKCGTTFATTMYNYLCTAEKMPQISPTTGINCTYCGEVGKHSHGDLQWDPKTWPILPFEQQPRCDFAVEFDHRNVFSNHFPLPLDAERTEGVGPVALFRDPRKRLVSAWNNNKHSYGCSGKMRKRLEAEAQNLSSFVAFPGIIECQTKMLVGKTCANDVKVTDAMADEAKRRLTKKMAFVGLTEMFNASVCLFHHMFGGTPKEFQFQPVGLERNSDFLFLHYHRSRKYQAMPGGGDRVHKDSWMEIETSVDKRDWDLYREVVKIFASRLQEYGLMKKQEPDVSRFNLS